MKRSKTAKKPSIKVAKDKSKSGSQKPSDLKLKAKSGSRPPQKLHSKPDGDKKPAEKPLSKGSSKADASTKSAKVKAPSPGLAPALSPKAKENKKVAVTPAAPVMKDSRLCRELLCETDATTNGYCRVHYIRNWRKIKRKELILKERKLNQYIEELIAKYPEKYIETIKQDLGNDQEFIKVVRDLDLSEGLDESSETESIDSYLDNIRRDIDVGVGAAGSGAAAGVVDEDEETF